jgi:hypothetical protein
MDADELLTRWTAQAAFLVYVLALSFRIVHRPTASRRMWASACLIYLVHVVCAFQFVHHWSHSEAYAATARRTAAVVGLDWGGGLYANYVFTLVWASDVCWLLLAPRKYETRPRFIDWSLQGFLGFMWFNATVVFGSGSARWLGVSACLLLGGTLVCTYRASAQR